MSQPETYPFENPDNAAEQEQERQSEVCFEGMQKIFQGEDPKRVTAWMADRGIPYSEAAQVVRDALFEMNHGGRISGLNLILQGGGMVLGAGVLYWISQYVGAFLLPLLMVGAFLVGLGYIVVGVFKLITNVGM
ncbi:MAG: hypothetical protein EP343_12595 [Deltaproteobacteria bacterium]|nr:MAG: hypothetical protein EP343_12595 [Deltaproteobacteria bacterium]